MMLAKVEAYFHEERYRVHSCCFCRYKILVIINDNKMVDLNLRKLISHFFIRVSDDGVGFEAYYHEEVRKSFFRLICYC